MNMQKKNSKEKHFYSHIDTAADRNFLHKLLLFYINFECFHTHFSSQSFLDTEKKSLIENNFFFSFFLSPKNVWLRRDREREKWMDKKRRKKEMWGSGWTLRGKKCLLKEKGEENEDEKKMKKKC